MEHLSNDRNVLHIGLSIPPATNGSAPKRSPSLHWVRRLYFRSWDERLYAGLSQFHAAKGFDPYSQDIARHLGCPLYKLSSCDQGSNGARIEEVLPEPDVGNPDMIADSSQTQNEDAQYNETHRDHQNKSVVEISNPQMDRQLTIRHVRFMVAGSLPAFFAFLSVYLYIRMD
ncbi:hypothetical protein B0H11DRAFT_1356833 [Mycena galericulata]|nr:hypothetical protein B0H11DRAFT_1356833 [Mycena galericulata]